MTDYIACGKVVPERIAAIVERHRRGLRAGRLRPGRRRDRRAPRAARARRVRRRRRRPPASWRPTGVLGAERVARRRRGDRAWRRPGCTPTATRWSATCCSTPPAGRSTATSPSSAGTLGEELLEPTRIYALDCLALAATTASTCTPSPHHRRRPGGQPGPGAPAGPRRRPGPLDLDPAADLRRCWRSTAGCARTEIERTFNLGVGMVAIVARGRRRRAIRLRDRPAACRAWVAGRGDAGAVPTR